MTYYSDLLLVIDHHEALACGQRPDLPTGDLIAVCRRVLAIEPDEAMARYLLARLETDPATGSIVRPAVNRPLATPAPRRAARPASAR